MQGVDERRSRDDGRSVLIVVINGDVHPGTERFLDVEALGRLDVLQVYAAEGRGKRRDGFYELVGVPDVELKIVDVDVGEELVEHALAFHDRLSRQRPDVSETENGASVGDHGQKIVSSGIGRSMIRVIDDVLAGAGDARGIGQRKRLL